MEYGHGGDIYTYKGMLDFSVNVNPFGPSEAVLEAAKRGIDKCCAYPDSQCRALREALAAKLGVPQEYILPGNGAADLFFSLVTAERPKKALIPVPAFSEYEQALRTVDCQIRYYQTEEKENFRLTERFLEKLTEDLDLVFLCSPSNPAGQVIPEDLLRRIIRRCGEKKIRLVLDECFIEFADREKAFYAEGEAENCPQLFVVRAFTKMHAIPGLRLGYGITSDTELLERLCRVRQPWSVSIPAQEAGIAALSEAEDLKVEKTRILIRAEREWLEQELREMGFRVIPSEANFILMYSSIDLAEGLKEQGILIRDCGNYRGLGKGWYRTAVRLHEENRLLAEALGKISEGRDQRKKRSAKEEISERKDQRKKRSVKEEINERREQ